MSRDADTKLTLRVRLIKKLARFINGVDLDKLRVGKCVDLPDKVARMLIAEGWAELPGTPKAADAKRPGCNGDCSDGS